MSLGLTATPLVSNTWQGRADVEDDVMGTDCGECGYLSLRSNRWRLYAGLNRPVKRL